MAIITRLARLFRADLHAVLDRVEEPDILLQQAVREMEEELGRDGQALKLMDQELEQYAQQHQQLRAALDKLEDELDVCFTADKLDLARALMKRKLQTEQSLQLLEHRRDELRTRRDRLQRRVDENHARFEAMRQKADLLRPQGQSTPDPWDLPDISVRDEDVEVAVLREQQRRAGS